MDVQHEHSWQALQFILPQPYKQRRCVSARQTWRPQRVAGAVCGTQPLLQNVFARAAARQFVNATIAPAPGARRRADARTHSAQHL